MSAEAKVGPDGPASRPTYRLAPGVTSRGHGSHIPGRQETAWPFDGVPGNDGTGGLHSIPERMPLGERRHLYQPPAALQCTECGLSQHR